MRSIVRRTATPAGVILLLSMVSVAHAEGPTIIARAGAPWIHVGGVYVGPKTANADLRGRAILATQAKLATGGKVALVESGIDRFGDGETIVRYAQTHEGLPVIGRGAAVRMSASGQPLTTVIDLEPTSDLPAHVVARVTPSAAASVASARFAVGASAREAHLIVWPTLDRGARLAYAVVPRMPAGIPSAPRAIVDAETGEVLEARDMLAFANASMFEFNPTKTPTLSSKLLSVAPTGPTLSNPFFEATNCIDKKTVKPVDFNGFKLNVHVCDLVQVATANAMGDFVYEPADVVGSGAARSDAFSEVSIYYHTSKAYSFFRDLQGDPEAQVVVDKPLRLVANLQIPAGFTSGNIGAASNPDTPLDTFQNAFFSPAGGGLGAVFQQLYGFNAGALWFGQGPKRDYAYDGDVVYHEFGHAVVDATLKLGAWHVDARGAVDAPGAMNEGLADYFSSAITGDPDVGEYAALDLGTSGKVIRTLANQDSCPNAVIGEVHLDSTLFSGAMWQARSGLPAAERTKFDRAIYKAMRTNPGRGDLGFEDLANLFIATLTTDYPTGASALTKAMTERGVLPTCERILSFEGKPIASFDRRIGFVAPGKQSVNVRGTAPGIVQVRAALPPGTLSVVVSFTSRAGGQQSPLAGKAKPFAPLVLAKLGAPITWDPKSKTGHDADLKAAATVASGSASATLEMPEGTTADAIYVQIASTGDSDGAYDGVSLAFSTGEVAPLEEPEEPEAPLPSAPSPSPPPATNGCAITGGAPVGKGALLPGILAVGAVLTALRRRRSTHR